MCAIGCGHASNLSFNPMANKEPKFLARLQGFLQKWAKLEVNKCSSTVCERVLLSMTGFKVWTRLLNCFQQFFLNMNCSSKLRHTLLLVDATVYPANAQYLNQALQNVVTILNFGPQCVAHCQLPVEQSNTTSKAVVKHTRTIQDTLFDQGMDILNTVTLHFQKPADCAANDKRKVVQLCLAVSADSDKSLWSIPPVISQIPLVKIAEMRGYDSEGKPGPSARTEQFPAFTFKVLLFILFALLETMVAGLLRVVIFWPDPFDQRKGVPAHETILAAYFNSVSWKAGQKVIIFDLVPNRPLSRPEFQIMSFRVLPSRTSGFCASLLHWSSWKVVGFKGGLSCLVVREK